MKDGYSVISLPCTVSDLRGNPVQWIVTVMCKDDVASIQEDMNLPIFRHSLIQEFCADLYTEEPKGKKVFFQD